ncbi:MAG: response regulator transcription factor [Candidatus Korobacteraceae bacterium]
MSNLRILIADDHDLVRKGLRMLIEEHPGWTVCGEARSGREAVEQATQHSPDIVVIDVSMPDLNGLEATRLIRKACPRSEVLVITHHDSDEIAAEVLNAGARGYVLKSDSDKDLVNAVEALSRHKPFFTSRITEMLLTNRENGVTDQVESMRNRLTVREVEILQLLAEGKTAKEVATSLGIATKTSDTHRTNIMRKLNLHSIAELVRYAIRNKIVEP